MVKIKEKIKEKLTKKTTKKEDSKKIAKTAKIADKPAHESDKNDDKIVVLYDTLNVQKFLINPLKLS